MLLPPMAGCDAAEASPPPTTPTAGQAIPLLTHTPCYSAAMAASHRSRTSEPSYSSPCGHPLSRLPRLRVSPFLGLVVVHCPGALGTAWQRGQRTTSIGRGLYVERLTTGSTATAQFFCDLPSKSLCQACWAANLSRRGELSFGW